MMPGRQRGAEGDQPPSASKNSPLLSSQLRNSEIVIPAEAGIQSFQEFLDPRFREADTFY